MRLCVCMCEIERVVEGREKKEREGEERKEKKRERDRMKERKQIG